MSDQKKTAAAETSQPASSSGSTNDLMGVLFIVFGGLSLLGIVVAAWNVSDGGWEVVRTIAAIVLALATAVMALVSAGLIRAVVFSRPDDSEEMIGQAIVGILGILASIVLWTITVAIGGKSFGEIVKETMRLF